MYILHISALHCLLLFFFFFFLFFFFFRARQHYCPGCTAALRLLCSPKFPFQYRFSSLMPLMKRQRSLTVAVRITLGSTTETPKTSNCRRAVASQRQIMCCTVSACCPQNLQTGLHSNRPIDYIAMLPYIINKLNE
jgi:hypothetical protein